MTSDKTNPIGIISEPGKQHVDKMVELFKYGQVPHHEKFPDMFGAADNDDQITPYICGFLKPRNPFRTRINFAAGWFIENELKGYLLYQLYENSNVFYGEPRWDCFVEDIVVAPDAQSMGGASMLLAYLMEQAESVHNCAVSGTVWDGNNASEALFRKAGFNDLSKTFYRFIK